MSSARRPDLDEECDYPHPPPGRFQPAPPTLAEILWDTAIPSIVYGVLMGGSVGLCVGLVAADFLGNSPLKSVAIILLAIVIGAATGGTVLGMLLAALLTLIIVVQHVLDLVTRPFRGKVDPDTVTEWR